MHFNKHSNLEGEHAFLSPSVYHWVNYTDEKLRYRFNTVKAALMGIEQHRFAKEAIQTRKLQKDDGSTLNLYINECIKFRMVPEQVLYYSPNCFGTVDAIAFRYRRLRISDLKTGVSRTSEHQLEVYAALFCLEYKIDPYEIKTELRIYQDQDVRVYDADPKYISYIMDKIVAFDKILNQLREEEDVS